MKYLMITNSISVGEFIVENGVDRVFIDLELLDKESRQGHLNTWKSNHSFSDIEKMRNKICGKKILVRLNPWNSNSKSEISKAIDYGADFLMIPMIKTFKDIKLFCEEVSNRVPVIPLIETKESIDFLHEIILLDGIEEVFIGLNDLSLSYGYKFMFEPLINGVLDNVANLLNANNIQWGFGGIAKKNNGLLPAEYILGEHVRLNSKLVILSRSFHENSETLSQLINENNFKNELNKINKVYKKWLLASEADLQNNHLRVKSIIMKLITN